MITTVFYGIFIAFAPLLVISTAFFYWAIRSGLLPAVRDPKALDRAIKAAKKDYKSSKKGKMNRRQTEEGMIWYDTKNQGSDSYLFKKWMEFGAGFYGLMALFTYGVIETGEIIDFFSNFTSIADFIDRIGIGMLIDFIIESIINFFRALLWPFYWGDSFDSTRNALIYLAEAYLGYRVGRHLSFTMLSKEADFKARFTAAQSGQEDQSGSS